MTAKEISMLLQAKFDQKLLADHRKKVPALM